MSFCPNKKGTWLTITIKTIYFLAFFNSINLLISCKIKNNISEKEIGYPHLPLKMEYLEAFFSALLIKLHV